LLDPLCLHLGFLQERGAGEEVRWLSSPSGFCPP